MPNLANVGSASFRASTINDISFSPTVCKQKCTNYLVKPAHFCDDPPFTIGDVIYEPGIVASMSMHYMRWDGDVKAAALKHAAYSLH